MSRPEYLSPEELIDIGLEGLEKRTLDNVKELTKAIDPVLGHLDLTEFATVLGAFCNYMIPKILTPEQSVGWIMLLHIQILKSIAAARKQEGR